MAFRALPPSVEEEPRTVRHPVLSATPAMISPSKLLLIIRLGLKAL